MKRAQKRQDAAIKAVAKKRAILAEDLASSDPVVRGIARINARDLTPTEKLFAQLRLLLRHYKP